MRIVRLLAVFTALLSSPYLKGQDNGRLQTLLTEWRAIAAGVAEGNDTGTVKLLNEISAIYHQQGSADSALFFGERAWKIADSLQYDRGLIKAYANLGRAHYQKGDYDHSMKAVVELLHISDKIDSDEGRAAGYNGRGLIFLAQDKFIDAMEDFRRASILNQRLQDLSLLGVNYFNLSLTYLELSRFDSAIFFLDKSTAIGKRLNDQRLMVMNYNRMGDTYERWGQPEKAISAYLKVINSSYKNNWEKCFAYTGLANCHRLIGRHAEAVSYGEKGLQLAKALGAKWDTRRALLGLHKAYAAKGDFRKAYQYSVEEGRYSDSLFNEEKEQQVSSLQLQQQRMENQVLSINHESAQQKARFNRMLAIMSALVAVLLLGITFVLFRSMRRKTRLYQALHEKTQNVQQQATVIESQNKELSRVNQTKDQLFSVISHDLRSPFASMQNTLELLKSGGLGKEETVYIIDKFSAQINVTLDMINNLLLWANSQQKGIQATLIDLSLADSINEVIAVLHHSAADKAITIRHIPNPQAIARADHNHVKIIFQNIIANAIKFTGQGGEVRIGYGVTTNRITVTIADNGVGMSDDKRRKLFTASGESISSYGTKNEKGIGIGLLLVKQFADENEISIDVESKEGQGTVFALHFPKA